MGITGCSLATLGILTIQKQLTGVSISETSAGRRQPDEETNSYLQYSLMAVIQTP